MSLAKPKAVPKASARTPGKAVNSSAFSTGTYPYFMKSSAPSENPLSSAQSQKSSEMSTSCSVKDKAANYSSVTPSIGEEIPIVHAPVSVKREPKPSFKKTSGIRTPLRSHRSGATSATPAQKAQNMDRFMKGIESKMNQRGLRMHGVAKRTANLGGEESIENSKGSARAQPARKGLSRKGSMSGYASCETLPTTKKASPTAEKESESFTARENIVQECLERRMRRSPVQEEPVEEERSPSLDSFKAHEERSRSVEATPPLIRLQKCQEGENPKEPPVAPFVVSSLRDENFEHFEPVSEERRSDLFGDLNALLPERHSARRQLFSSFSSIGVGLDSARAPREIGSRLHIERRSLSPEERQSLREKKMAVLQNVERMVLKDNLSKDLEVIKESTIGI